METGGEGGVKEEGEWDGRRIRWRKPNWREAKWCPRLLFMSNGNATRNWSRDWRPSTDWPCRWRWERCEKSDPGSDGDRNGWRVRCRKRDDSIRQQSWPEQTKQSRPIGKRFHAICKEIQCHSAFWPVDRRWLCMKNNNNIVNNLKKKKRNEI